MHSTLPPEEANQAAGHAARSGADPGTPPAPRKRHKKKPLPWTRPLNWLWLVLALAASVWMTVNMPVHSTGMHRQHASIAQQAAQPGHAASVQAPGLSGSADKQPATHKKRQVPVSAAEKISARLRLFGRLFFFVGLGALLGGIIEGRRWYLVLAKSLGRVTRAARLPDIVGFAMPAALASAPAANSMIAARHARGEISDSALIAGGMTNGFLAYVSHSARTMYPVMAAIGLPGLFFFLIQIGGEFLFILAVLCWNRLHTIHTEAQGTAQAPAADAGPDVPSSTAPKVLSWKETLKAASLNALALLFRLCCISVPMVLAMEWCLGSGLLSFWETSVPGIVVRYFPKELLAVIAAQAGGLVQSSAVAASLLDGGLVSGPQVLLAMLAASAIGNPFRALRRNLPAALAIFPTRIALIIVGGMQFTRFLVTLLGSLLVLLWITA